MNALDIEKFMSKALEMARVAYEYDEVPVGAVIVKEGKIIGRGFNQVIKKNIVTSHAELNAIADASKNIDNYRLIDCDMFVTLEPCHMCAKAIVDARLNHLYFGAREPKTGSIVSIDKFFDRKELNHSVNYSGGHFEELSSKLLKDFFQLRR